MQQGSRITLKNCSKTFPDGTRALLPVNLTINAGETVVFLGPSGCGKTTTLRLIAGLDHPDCGGQIFFDDQDVTALPIEKRNIGMVFQSYALFPNMTVSENILYGLKVRKISTEIKTRKLMEMLEMFHLEELSHRRINQLSGGQKQRVALARAIIIEPRVLLLDEPLSALDALLRERLRIEISELLKQLGITAIYVTHDQEEAMALGDRIVVMNSGQIAQCDVPEKVYYEPDNAFVADFVGTINHFDGVLSTGRMQLPGGSLVVSEERAVREEKMSLLVRPEDITLTPVDSDDHDLMGVVERCVFLGSRSLISVSGAARNSVQVVSDGRNRFKTGQRVALSIPTKHHIYLES